MNKLILQKLIFKSGFVSYGYKVYGGWEYTNPINPDIKDKVIKAVTIKEIKNVEPLSQT